MTDTFMTSTTYKPNQKMGEMIEYLTTLLGRQFSRSVSKIYFGDIGVYLPSSFGGSRREQKAVIAIQPVYSRLREGERVAAFENRDLGVRIIVMVNITPFFEADPKEAYGERMLVELATEVATFLTQEEHSSLGGRVQTTLVGDINWAWVARGNQAIRGAAIDFSARVRIPRM